MYTYLILNFSVSSSTVAMAEMLAGPCANVFTTEKQSSINQPLLHPPPPPLNVHKY